MVSVGSSASLYRWLDVEHIEEGASTAKQSVSLLS